MWDFLTFDTFITKYILMFFYYLFAITIPIIMYIFRKKFFEQFQFIENIQKKYKVYLLIIFIFMIICGEICLRIFFEILIGYFDMHDYLQQIVSKKYS